MTRHYEHPNKTIKHPRVTITTAYGNGKPLLRAKGATADLNALEKQHNLRPTDNTNTARRLTT